MDKIFVLRKFTNALLQLCRIQNIWIELNWIETDTSLQYSTATEGCVSNDFFRYSLDDSQTSYLTQVPSPSLNTVELIVINDRPCKHSSKLQLSIRFTPSRCLDVRQDWYPMYYPEYIFISFVFIGLRNPWNIEIMYMTTYSWNVGTKSFENWSFVWRHFDKKKKILK